MMRYRSFIVESTAGKDKGMVRFSWNGSELLDEDKYVQGNWDGIVAEWFVQNNSLPIYSFIWDAKQSQFRTANRNQKLSFINKYMVCFSPIFPKYWKVK